MWEECITIKHQMYYNNNHTSTLKASKQKIYKNKKHKT